MIVGSFDGTGRSFVSVTIYLYRLGLSGSIRIQVDTGADITCLHPEASKALGIPYEELNKHNMATAGGVGGKSKYYVEPAILYFVSDDGGDDEEIAVDLHIAKPNKGNKSLESLLGTNIINKWRMNYDPPNGKLEFFPKSDTNINSS